MAAPEELADPPGSGAALPYLHDRLEEARGIDATRQVPDKPSSAEVRRASAALDSRPLPTAVRQPARREHLTQPAPASRTTATASAEEIDRQAPHADPCCRGGHTTLP